MNLLKSNIAHLVLKTVETNEGVIYFFNHIAVIEINEGVHVDLETAKNTIHELINYFGESRSYGLVANRVNSYSISLLEINEVKAILPNLVAYGVVSYNSAGAMNAKIENSFCKTQNIQYQDLYECIDKVYQNVKESITLSLD